MSVNKAAKLYRLILAALITACMIFHVAVLAESRHKIAAGYGDFIIFYTGAQIVNDGKSAELYNVETQNAYQAKFDVPKLSWPLPFNHAAYELLFFLPLVQFSYPVAHLIWSGLNLLLIVAMLRWLIPYVDSPYGFFIGASVLSWFPTMEALRLGQDSILSAAILLAVFVALKQKRDAWVGALLALGLYKPQVVLPLVGAFLIAGRWKSLEAFGITAMILVAVSLGMVGWRGAIDLVSILSQMDRYSFVVQPLIMPNVRGLSAVLWHSEILGHSVAMITVVISLVLYLSCLYFWRKEYEVRDPRFDLRFSLTLVVTVLISYHLYAHDLFLLSLSLVLLFRYISLSRSAHWLLPYTFFLLLMFLFLPYLPRYLIESKAFGWGAVPVLLLFVIIMVEIVYRKGGETVEPRSQVATLSTD